MGVVAALFCAFAASAAVAAADGSTADVTGLGEDLARQAFILLGAILLPVIMRTASMRRALAFAVTVVGLIAAATILYAYFRFAGVRLLSIAELAEFKYFAERDLHVAVNPLSFGTALALALGAPAWWPRRWSRAAILAVGTSAVLLSGARTTVVSVGATALVVPVLRLAMGQRGRVRMAGRAFLGVATVAAAWALIDFSATLDGEAASAITTGRYDLWIAALGQFMERPFFGTGSSGAFDNISAYLPGYYRWGNDTLLESAGSGGYHNAYLALLTQRGLVGFAAGVALVAFLLRRAFRHSERGPESSQLKAPGAALVPYITIAIVLRGLGEQPGFFGAANGLVDFLAYAAAAQVVALDTMRWRQARGERVEAAR
jgi:O-antigen ligase